MVDFTWSINNLSVQNVDDLNNVVVFAGFRIAGREGDLTANVEYSVNLLPPNPENYTPFDQITEDQAVQWVKDSLAEHRIARMEAEVIALIEAQKTPVPLPVPLPWVKSEDPTEPLTP